MNDVVERRHYTAAGVNQEEQRPAKESQKDSGPAPTHSLSGALDRLDSLADKQQMVSIGDALDRLGKHSFAPLLLIPGLIMVVPGPADIPGVPTLLGALVILIAVQMIMKREHLWVPRWLEKRHVRSGSVKKMLRWMRRPAGWIDRVTKRRYTRLIDHGGYAMAAIACILIAAATPLLEFVPFSANLAGAAIAAFAIALMARDGVVAGAAIAMSLGTILLVGYQFVGG